MVFCDGWPVDADVEGDRLVELEVVSPRYFNCGVIVGETKIFPLIVGVEDGVVGVDCGGEGGPSVLFGPERKVCLERLRV